MARMDEDSVRTGSVQTKGFRVQGWGTSQRSDGRVAKRNTTPVIRLHLPSIQM